jgi:hypothetical protein
MVLPDPPALLLQDIKNNAGHHTTIVKTAQKTMQGKK